MIDRDSLYDLIEKRFLNIAGVCDHSALRIRHGKKSIWASDIEEAYYCEKKLDLMYNNPTYAGMNFETYTDFSNVPDLTKILGIFNSVPIGGSIDHLEVSGDLITVVVEKYMSDIPNRPFNSHEVSGRVLCYCLDYMLAETFPYKLDYRIEYYDIEDTKGYNRKFHQTYHYDQRTKLHLNDELDFVLGYWLEKREAKAQKSSRAKCEDCDYNSICDNCLMLV